MQPELSNDFLLVAAIRVNTRAGMVSYQYDPFGRRIEKVSPAGTTIYAYDGDNVVEELDGGGMAVARYARLGQTLAL